MWHWLMKLIQGAGYGFRLVVCRLNALKQAQQNRFFAFFFVGMLAQRRMKHREDKDCYIGVVSVCVLVLLLTIGEATA